MPDVIVVGAGLAGLSAARELAGLGLAVRVVEREETPGGRCATRPLDGQPMDFGCAFLHGRTPDFIAVLEAVPGRALWGWPRRGDGPGAPCQPDALDPPQKRVVFEQGLDRLPRHLAVGLDVRFGCAVSALAQVSGGIACQLTDGGEDLAKCVVVTAPLPEARRLLGTLTPRPAALARITPLLDLVTTEPCAVALARYPADAPVPVWDVSLPEWGALATLVHDSSKRAAGAAPAFVLHGRGAWSRAVRDADPDVWARELLAAAAARHGAWLASPETVDTHDWPAARVVRPSELAAPLLEPLERGGLVGLAGDAFAPETGLEGAWHSGRRIARAIAGALRARAA